MRKQHYLIFGLILIVGLIIISCTQKPVNKQTSSVLSRTELGSLNENNCKQKGFEWVHIPGLCAPNEKGEYDCGNRCDIPTKDAGKKCYSNNDCEGVCLCTKNEKDSQGFQIGECSKYMYFTEVVDCPCILETKSKTENFPYGCA